MRKFNNLRIVIWAIMFVFISFAFASYLRVDDQASLVLLNILVGIVVVLAVIELYIDRKSIKFSLKKTVESVGGIILSAALLISLTVLVPVERFSVPTLTIGMIVILLTVHIIYGYLFAYLSGLILGKKKKDEPSIPTQ